MPAPVEETPITPAAPAPVERNFNVESQSLSLDLDFRARSVIGKTLISVQPLSNQIRTFPFHCRQCRPTKVLIEGKEVSSWRHDDPYRFLTPHKNSTVHQHHQLQSRLDALPPRLDGELSISLPKSFQIKEADSYTSSTLQNKTTDLSLDPAEANAAAGRFASINIEIHFELRDVRDGLQWVGCDGSTSQWPHIYTRNSPFPGSASCIFPCVDDLRSRHPWTISIKTPRTLGDAFGTNLSSGPSAGNEGRQAPGNQKPSQLSLRETATTSKTGSNPLGLTEQEMDLDMTVTCSGDLTDVNVAHSDASHKTVSFLVSSSISANQIGFSVGPFEHVDLSDLREVDEDERLGEQAVRVHAFCLPGRAAEVRNACMPLAKAVDFFTTTYTTFTGESWKLCFVDDLVQDTVDTAGFTICSTRILFPEDIIDPLYPVTRTLIHALAAQYAGINIVPSEPKDSWVIAGISSFMTDTYMKILCGNNEYRFRQKITADKVTELDVNRPSIYDLGAIMSIDPLEREFMSLKAGAVLFILDRRLTKSSGSAGVTRIIGRILHNAKDEELDSSMLSTSQFVRLCVKMGHIDLEAFFNQWIFGAGCPTFEIRQQFNKKKLVIAMTISQVQADKADSQQELDPATFLRDVKEDAQQVYAGGLQPVFTGPMTIRIHEADGTPYEHIVEISKAYQTFEIPYNNKYKRKKSKRQKARLVAAAGANAEGGDGQDDVLLYSLGDVLQSDEEVANWRLTDWTREMEEKMSEESFEWIRMDADFEWIARMSVHMPAYMWVSQLQQDRDVVAQLESLKWFNVEVQKRAHPLTSTFLIRTLLDKRYFHGIRTRAASMLSGCAKAEVDWVGLYQLQKAFQEFYCIDESAMTKPNDFSDRTAYVVQCAILRAMSDVKDNFDRTPPSVKKFFLEKLKFNDNSNNECSDAYYVTTLLQCLTKSLLGPPIEDDDEAEIEAHSIQREAIAEIDRYRRMDEWTSSFQNTYTTTALDCMLKLAKGNIVQPKLTEFLHYTRPENSYQVRLKAYDCLVELGLLRNKAVMRYILHEMSHDRSPSVRERLYRIWGKGLGMIAVGDQYGDKHLPETNGLVVEHGGLGATEAKQAEVSRRQTTSGALGALKAELSSDESFKEALWSAVSSPIVSAHELVCLVEICSLLFDTNNSLLIKLRMPRYWQVKHLGGAKLTFTQTSKVRWQSQKPPEPKPQAPILKLQAPAPPPVMRRDSSPAIPLKLAFEKGTTLKRKESSSHINGGGPTKKSKTDSAPSPSTAVQAMSPPVERKSNIVRLKVGPRAFKLKPQTKPSLSVEASPSISSDINSAQGHGESQFGYGPVNGNTGSTAAPLGYGRIIASPAQTPSSPAPPTNTAAPASSTASEPASNSESFSQPPASASTQATNDTQGPRSAPQPPLGSAETNFNDGEMGITPSKEEMNGPGGAPSPSLPTSEPSQDSVERKPAPTTISLANNATNQPGNENVNPVPKSPEPISLAKIGSPNSNGVAKEELSSNSTTSAHHAPQQRPDDMSPPPPPPPAPQTTAKKPSITLRLNSFSGPKSSS